MGSITQRQDVVPYCAMARNADQTSIVNTANTKVLLNTTLKDSTGSMADLVNNKIVVPRAGMYRIGFAVDCQMVGTVASNLEYYLQLTICKNTSSTWLGRSDFSDRSGAAGTGAGTLVGSIDAALAANDAVLLYFQAQMLSASPQWKLVWFWDAAWLSVEWIRP